MPVGSSRETTRTTLTANVVEMPEVWLCVEGPSSKTLEVQLTLAPVMIGTSASAHVRLEDPEVSRRHASFRLDERGVRFTDHDSKNGSWIGECRVSAATLGPETSVRVGSHTLTIRTGGRRELVELHQGSEFRGVLGASVRMRALFARLRRVAATDESVLLLGESGTGKELLARALHEESQRSGRPFLVLDCAGLSSSLIEAELFGHAKGAFTGASAERRGIFEEADGGTVFIDEVGELPLELQGKLLRALEARTVRRLGESRERRIDVRIVAATHRPLKQRARTNEFREDLFYRLSVVELEVPPLRERKDEIPHLVARFLLDQKPPRKLESLPPNALAQLMAYDWPGNVRELRNAVTRLCLFPDDRVLDSVTNTKDPGGHVEPSATAVSDPVFDLPLRQGRELVVANFERRAVQAALSKNGGNVSRAAEQLGVSRQFLHRLMSEYGVAKDGA